MTFLESAVYDVRYGMRLLRRTPGLSLVAILTLALGIGGNASVLALVDTIYFRPLPIPAPERVYRVQSAFRADGDVQLAGVPGARFEALQASGAFAAVTAASGEQATLLDGAAPERITVVHRSAGWSAALGATPATGRDFTREEEERGEDAGVAILAHHLWRDRYGAAPLGTLTVRIDGRRYSVVGVMAPGFRFPYLADVWVPSHPGPSDSREYAVFGRVRTGTTRVELQAAMDGVAASIRAAQPETPAGFGLAVRTLRDNLTEGEDRPALALTLLVGFLFAIAAVNVAALMVARSVVRRKELALRAALGAVRWRQVRQLVTETAMLAGLGGAAGVLLACWLQPALTTLIPSNIREQLGLAAPAMDVRVMLATAILTAGAATIAGVLPVLSGARVDATALAEGGRSTRPEGRGVRRTLTAFVVMQVAFTVVLFAGAALMVQQLRSLERRRLGFSTAGIVTAQLTPSLASHPRGPARAAFIARIVDEIASSGDVESAAAMTMNPLGGATWAVPIVAEGAAAGGTPLNVAHQLITPGLLRTLGIPLVSGRDVTRDDTAGRTRVAIVSTTLAAKLWPGHSPLGSRLRIAIDGAPLVTVVGVVGDVPPAPGSDLPQAAWYLSYAQMAATRAADDVRLMVRVKGSAASAGPSIAAAVHRVDGEAALYGVRTLDDYRASTLQADRLGARLMAAVGIFAIALIAVGVYGVLAFSVAARRTELSIRGALGATAANLRGLVLRDSLKVTGAGLAIGGAGAAIVTRALAALLPQAGGSRLSALLLSAFVVLMVSMLAALVPAVRAGRLVEQRPE